MIKIETNRLILRDYSLADGGIYYKLKSDSETMFYLQDIKLDDKQESHKDFEKVLADIESPYRVQYFLHIELKETLEQVGSIGYTVTDITPVGKLAHMGYFTYPKFWGKGYVTEALQEVLRFAFEKNDVYRVTTGCLKENQGSERVMQKCGMLKEAERVNWEWHEGEMKTRVEYRMLKSDWLKTDTPKEIGEKI